MRESRATASSRRTLCVLAAALALLATPLGAFAQDGSGGKNVVLAFNQTDGRTMGRSGIAVGRAAGPSALPENLASAKSSCSNCRTVAVAMQAVLVTGDPDVAAPHNAASAVNADCTGCWTMAYAYQYVVTTGRAVTLSPAGEQAIARIRNDAAEAAGSDATFTDLEARLDALAAQLKQVIDEETRAAGGRGVSGRSVKTARPNC